MNRTIGSKVHGQTVVRGTPPFVDKAKESFHQIPDSDKKLVLQYVPIIAETIFCSRLQFDDNSLIMLLRNEDDDYMKNKWYPSVITHETQHAIDATNHYKRLPEKQKARMYHEKGYLQVNHYMELERRAMRRQYKALLEMNAPKYVLDHSKHSYRNPTWNSIPLEQR